MFLLVITVAITERETSASSQSTLLSTNSMLQSEGVEDPEPSMRSPIMISVAKLLSKGEFGGATAYTVELPFAV